MDRVGILVCIKRAGLLLGIRVGAETHMTVTVLYRNASETLPYAV